MSDNAKNLIEWARGQIIDPNDHINREAAGKELGFDYATRRGVEIELEEAGLLTVVNSGHFMLT